MMILSPRGPQHRARRRVVTLGVTLLGATAACSRERSNVLSADGTIELTQVDSGLRRDRGDIGSDIFGEARMAAPMKHDESIDPQILMHGEADARPPLVPPRRPELGGVERGAEESDDRERFHILYCKINFDLCR